MRGAKNGALIPSIPVTIPVTQAHPWPQCGCWFVVGAHARHPSPAAALCSLLVSTLSSYKSARTPTTTPSHATQNAQPSTQHSKIHRGKRTCGRRPHSRAANQPTTKNVHSLGSPHHSSQHSMDQASTTQNNQQLATRNNSMRVLSVSSCLCIWFGYFFLPSCCCCACWRLYLLYSLAQIMGFCSCSSSIGSETRSSNSRNSRRLK